MRTGPRRPGTRISAPGRRTRRSGPTGYAGRFDEGWDAYPEETFARQKELGVIPADAELSRHDPDVPEWETYRGGAINASYPAIRAIEALAATAPLFLLLFAAIYFLIPQADLNNFNVHSLTTDALYFTVTIFATVGFGDIVATTQLARLVVTVQMILDLGVLGLGIRVFLGAVQRGRQQHTAQQETESS